MNITYEEVCKEQDISEVVVVSQYQNHYVLLLKNDHYLLPTRSRQKHDDIMKAAQSLLDELGAEQFHLVPLTSYEIVEQKRKGILFFAQIDCLTKPLDDSFCLVKTLPQDKKMDEVTRAFCKRMVGLHIYQDKR